MQHDNVSSFSQSDHCFRASSLPLPSSLLKLRIGNFVKPMNLEHADKRYEHRNPQKVSENEKVKILWDMKIQTDKIMDHSRPDIVLLKKGSR